MPRDHWSTSRQLSIHNRVESNKSQLKLNTGTKEEKNLRKKTHERMTKKNQRNRLEKLNRRIKDAKCGDQKQKKNKKPKTM